MERRRREESGPRVGQGGGRRVLKRMWGMLLARHQTRKKRALDRTTRGRNVFCWVLTGTCSCDIISRHPFAGGAGARPGQREREADGEMDPAVKGTSMGAYTDDSTRGKKNIQSKFKVWCCRSQDVNNLTLDEVAAHQV